MVADLRLHGRPVRHWLAFAPGHHSFDFIPGIIDQLLVFTHIDEAAGDDIRRSEQPSVLLVNRADNHKYAFCRHYLAVPKNYFPDITDAKSVNKHYAILHPFFGLNHPVFCDLKNIAIIKYRRIFLRYADALRQLGMMHVGR